MTGDAIVDRLRSICVGAPFEWIEATRWDSFELQPTTNIDGVFRVHPPSSQVVRGQFGYVEDRTDTIQVWVARKHNSDFDGVRQALLRDVHSLTSAIVRDAHQVSGEYVVLDEGRGHSIGVGEAEEGSTDKEYVSLRITFPVNYEVQL